VQSASGGCRRFWGVLGACNAPLQRLDAMVQRDAAGSSRVSLDSIFFSPPRLGAKGVEKVLVRNAQWEV